MEKENVVEVEQEALKIAGSIGTAMTTLEQLEVKTEEQFLTAVDWLARVKVIAKEIEAKEKSFTKPLNDTLKKIRDVFRGQKEAAEKARRFLEQEKILPYQREKARLEEEEKQRKAAELRKAEEAILANNTESSLEDAVKLDELAVKIETGKLEAVQAKTDNTTMTIQKRWTFEIVDPYALPRKYCVPDERSIRAAVSRGEREIPGVNIFQKEVVVNR